MKSQYIQCKANISDEKPIYPSSHISFFQAHLSLFCIHSDNEIFTQTWCSRIAYGDDIYNPQPNSRKLPVYETSSSPFIQENFFHPFLVHAPPPSSSQPFLGCMTLSWRRPTVVPTFTKNPMEETSKRASKASTRVPPIRVRMANSSLSSPPSQFSSRNSGAQSIQTKYMAVH